jgi:DNA-binding ferritin-like protein
MKDIENVIQRLLQTRDQSHMFHWNTKSYAAHEALGDFYDALLGHIDRFFEAYKGKYPEIFMRKAKIPFNVVSEPMVTADVMVGYFNDFNKFLAMTGETLSSKGDGDLEHIILDMQNETNKLLFLLQLK